MKTKTIILGITGLAFSLMAYIGKGLDMAGSNELLLVGIGIIIFGFLLPVTLHSNDSAKSGGGTHWLGFIGLAAVLIGISLVVLKYFMAATLFLALGSIGASVHFVNTSTKLSN